ncbi:DNRLRE domain-containing protein [Paenibacillaceae bacterium]|nr:DNRLRE domain-containing protein [Paenibacillaceae bacterium]
MNEPTELVSLIDIRSPSNKMEGLFVLYQAVESSIDASVTVSKVEKKELESFIDVRSGASNNINASIKVMYRVDDELNGVIDVVPSSYLHSFVEVRPNNRMEGIFELFEATRNIVPLNPVQDSVVRSRPDLSTINYGDMSMMMIGKSTDESFESFISFDHLKNVMNDVDTFERARLKLYYNGLIQENTNIELYLSNEKWHEYGITYANRPSHGEKISANYEINTKEKYIEFDLLDVVKNWYSDKIENYGLIISSNNDFTTTFFTRESQPSRRPVLEIVYIPNTIQSPGRSDLNGSLFVWSLGVKELSSYFTVHSDYGESTLHATLYVHRYEVPIEDEWTGQLVTSKPDLHSEIRIVRSDKSDCSGYISIANKIPSSLDSSLIVSKPEINGFVTINQHTSIEGFLNVRQMDSKLIESSITISRPEIHGFIEVPSYEYLSSFLTVFGDKDSIIPSQISVSKPFLSSQIAVRALAKKEMNGSLVVVQNGRKELISDLSVSRPEIHGFLEVRALGDDSLDGFIEIPVYNDMHSTFGVSRPEAHGYIDVRVVGWLDGFLYVKQIDQSDGFITVNQISELTGTLMVMKFNDLESKLAVSKPELVGFLYPRVQADKDLNSIFNVRQRDVSDLSGYLHVAGGEYSYYFIL